MDYRATDSMQKSTPTFVGNAMNALFSDNVVIWEGIKLSSSMENCAQNVLLETKISI